MKHYGFDEKSIVGFHKQIARDTKVYFDPEFIGRQDSRLRTKPAMP